MAITILPTSFSLFPFERSHTCSFSLSLLHTSTYCHFCQSAISVKINNLLICFCNFDLSCPLLEKCNFIKTIYTVLSFLTLFVSLYISIIGFNGGN